MNMAGSRCRVSFTDSEGVLHGVDVEAESLYEAVAIAVAQFREDEVGPSNPGPMTEFTVAVYKNPTSEGHWPAMAKLKSATRNRKLLRALNPLCVTGIAA